MGVQHQQSKWGMVGLGGCFFSLRRNHAQTQHFSNITNAIAGQSIQQKTHPPQPKETGRLLNATWFTRHKNMGQHQMTWNHLPSLRYTPWQQCCFMPVSLPGITMCQHDTVWNPFTTHHDSKTLQAFFMPVSWPDIRTCQHDTVWNPFATRHDSKTSQAFFTPVSWPDIGTWQHDIVWNPFVTHHSCRLFHATTFTGFFTLPNLPDTRTWWHERVWNLSLIHISEPTRPP